MKLVRNVVQDDDFIALIRKLLHLREGRLQTASGGYSIPIRCISDADLLDHLNGSKAIAFSVCILFKHSRQKAGFLGIDIDQKFSERLPFYAVALDRLKLSRAAFATSGSDPGRGKVLITLKDFIDADVARFLIEEIHRVAVAISENTLPKTPKDGDLELYPKGGQGGLLRVLGRNAFRNGPVESMFGLDGSSIDPAAIKPIGTQKALIVAKKLGYDDFHELPSRLSAFIEKPSRDIGFKEGRKKVADLAHYMARKYDGASNGHERFINLLTHCSASATGQVKRNVESELKAPSLWARACDDLTAFEVIPEKTPGASLRHAMERFVQKHGLFREHFSASTEQLVGQLGIYGSAVCKQVDTAQKSRIVLKLHPGWKRSRGMPGQPAFYAIPSCGQTLEELWAASSLDAHLKYAYETLPIFGCSDPRKLGVIPTFEFWESYKHFMQAGSLPYELPQAA